MENFRSLQKLRKFDIKVAVIGAGPAGLSSAYFLAREGFDVTVFDKSEKPGGTVANTIPGFRIPRWAIENDIKLIKKMGVKFEMNCNPEVNIKQLKSNGFKYINLAIGAMNSRMMIIDGDQDKILSAIKFLHNFNADPNTLGIGENVAVIGGGNSAMDAARAAKRVPGVKNVYIIYRRTIKQMPADKEELEFAIEDGIEFNELANPVSLKKGILKCQIMKLGEKDESGRKRPLPIEGKFVDIEIDTVLSAIGEVVDHELLEKNQIEIKNWNITVDEYNETSIENVFISGDAYHGPSSVVKAIADAQIVANGILAKENLKKSRVEVANFKFNTAKRLLEIDNKKAVISSTKNEIDEPNRCLECNLVCNKCIEVCPNRANMAVKVPEFKNVNQILHLDGLCNECGNCETFCPYDGAPYKDKFTLFWSNEDMEVNGNDGFLLTSEKDSIEFKVRVNDKIYMANFDNTGKLLNCKSDYEIDQKAEFDSLMNIIWWTYKNHRFLFM